MDNLAHREPKQCSSVQMSANVLHIGFWVEFITPLTIDDNPLGLYLVLLPTWRKVLP